jgi:pimeloyl-ACP methyl ester carboxylesterase
LAIRYDESSSVFASHSFWIQGCSNPPLYGEWQAYFRNYQPPTLIVWGKNDPIFPAVGAEPYKRDLKNLEFHLLDTGHFALEEDGDEIARYMESFLDEQVKRPRAAA